MKEVGFAGLGRLRSAQSGFIEETQHPARPLIALPLTRTCLRPLLDECECVLPQRTIQIAFGDTAGPARIAPTRFQRERAAGEVAGPYQVIEQPGQNPERLPATALRPGAGEEAAMIASAGQSPCLLADDFISLWANARFGLELCHESTVLAEIRQGASSRLQDRASSRQGLRDLQEQPAFQGAAALRGDSRNLMSRPRKRPCAFLDVASAGNSRRIRQISACHRCITSEHLLNSTRDAALASGEDCP